MFRTILWSQWKAARGLVLLTTVIAFALPVVSVNFLQNSANAHQIVNSMQSFGALYPMLAALTGLLVAIAAWAPDHAGRHMYALSLPVSRPRYAAMRYGAGAMFVGITVLALLVGTGLVAVAAAVPDGLHVYSLALTARFMLAAMVAYSIFFAVSSSTSQTAGVILGVVAAVLLTHFALDVTNVRYNLLGKVMDIMLYQPGLFSVFAGRWMLVDA